MNVIANIYFIVALAAFVTILVSGILAEWREVRDWLRMTGEAVLSILSIATASMLWLPILMIIVALHWYPKLARKKS